MTHIVDQIASEAAETGPVRCPICAHGNIPGSHCRHVRWAFDQGDPLDFAFFAVETSPYTDNGGHRTTRIPRAWWAEHGEWIVERVLFNFGADEGYVFGEVARLDLLARDIWKAFRPEPAPQPIVRV
jgi:hypothetical protein